MASSLYQSNVEIRYLRSTKNQGRAVADSKGIRRHNLEVGDHIYTLRAGGVYAHHGIYVGNGQVIHFTARDWGSSGSSQCHAPCPICPPKHEWKGVVCTCLNCFLAGGGWCLFEYGVSRAHFFIKGLAGTCTPAAADPVEDVIHRATYLLHNGFGCYNLFENNCENFAVYCKTGLVVQNKAGQSGQVLAKQAGVLSLVGPFPLMFFTRYAFDIGVRADTVKVPVEDLSKWLR